MPAPASARLVVRLADGSIQEHDLDAEAMHVGRDVSCEIRIISPYVSRHHALIRRAEDGFVIEDERSTNGLQINGRMVREPHSLVDGDCVAIGDVTLTYEEPDALTTAVFIAPGASKAAVSGGSTASPVSDRRPGVVRPAGLCTILFTDLVDHTRQVTQLGDIAGQRWLRRHTTMLREQFQRFGGEEEKWTGDGFLVTFDSARRALQAAIAIQQALNDYNAEPVEGPIRVRLGLNTGEVLREDGELFGNAVILASRVMSEAGAGEILISELMHRLIEPSGEFKAVDRGVFNLKGFATEQRLYEVQWRPDA
jgi:class 3 adenylate cyclase